MKDQSDWTWSRSCSGTSYWCVVEEMKRSAVEGGGILYMQDVAISPCELAKDLELDHIGSLEDLSESYITFEQLEECKMNTGCLWPPWNLSHRSQILQAVARLEAEGGREVIRNSAFQSLKHGTWKGSSGLFYLPKQVPAALSPKSLGLSQQLFDSTTPPTKSMKKSKRHLSQRQVIDYTEKQLSFFIPAAPSSGVVLFTKKPLRTPKTTPEVGGPSKRFLPFFPPHRCPRSSRSLRPWRWPSKSRNSQMRRLAEMFFGKDGFSLWWFSWFHFCLYCFLLFLSVFCETVELECSCLEFCSSSY